MRNAIQEKLIAASMGSGDECGLTAPRQVTMSGHCFCPLPAADWRFGRCRVNGLNNKWALVLIVH